MIDDLDAVRAVGSADTGRDPDARARIRARVLAPPPKRHWASWIAAGVSTAALASLAIAYVLVVGSAETADRRAVNAPPSTAPTPALGAPSLFPAAGQFLYVRSVGAYRSCSQDRDGITCKLRPPREREVWLSPTGPGRLRQGGGSTPERLGATALFIGNHRFTRAELAAYRPTGAELLRTLQQERVPGQGGDTASYPYVQITDVLREGIAPPALRAALIDALRLTPGVAELGPAADREGRRGLAFARERDGLREWALIDPVSFTLLEERETVLNKSGDTAAELSGFDVGDQIGGAIYLQRAVVNSDRQRP